MQFSGIKCIVHFKCFIHFLVFVENHIFQRAYNKSYAIHMMSLAILSLVEVGMYICTLTNNVHFG